MRKDDQPMQNATGMQSMQETEGSHLMNNEQLVLKRFFTDTETGTYVLLPFVVPERTERIDITYAYARCVEETVDGRTAQTEQAVIDLFLHDADGVCVGSSGSERTHIFVSGCEATPGFRVMPLKSGQWAVGAGVYKVPAAGVEVTWTVSFTPKKKRLFRGDTHVHTEGSDGWMSAMDTATHAARQGLDFLFLTDHNNVAHNEQLPVVPGITVLPGTEWTHYKGHAGFLGVKNPYASTFVANSMGEMQAMLADACQRGAFVVLNHPFCPQCPWIWGFDDIAHDAVEIWNGVMSERNQRALHWWHAQLVAGHRLPAIGGSDYHRPGLLGSMGMPCLCLSSWSREPEDLLRAMRAGNGYISYLPQGPGVVPMNAELGGEVPVDEPLSFLFTDLKGGDVIRILTDKTEEAIPCPSETSSWEMERKLGSARFMRFEVLRSYAPGLPLMTAMVSNPVWSAEKRQGSRSMDGAGLAQAASALASPACFP